MIGGNEVHASVLINAQLADQGWDITNPNTSNSARGMPLSLMIDKRVPIFSSGVIRHRNCRRSAGGRDVPPP
jgi:hypothetical protein